jgi:hypothetical protein
MPVQVPRFEVCLPLPQVWRNVLADCDRAQSRGHLCPVVRTSGDRRSLGITTFGSEVPHRAWYLQHLLSRE